MTPAEQAHAIFTLQSLIITRDEEIVRITAERDAARRQVVRQKETILDYRGRIRCALEEFEKMVRSFYLSTTGDDLNAVRRALTDEPEKGKE